ncbi:hypothetical protein EX30DRAFT_350486 [Ascodesmis nigricans]|uniref:YDG domain-containing protein n=1 Tax=Ascodesmis nigricans TaxID=341454 RepID=A0A4S2MS12_9PEZI|nr:hypothetical protein EX30DRAFT_350486 [Ascodesmis nigricans]
MPPKKTPKFDFRTARDRSKPYPPPNGQRRTPTKSTSIGSVASTSRTRNSAPSSSNSTRITSAPTESNSTTMVQNVQQDCRMVTLQNLRYIKMMFDNAKTRLDQARNGRNGSEEKFQQELDGMLQRGLARELAKLGTKDFRDADSHSVFLQSGIKACVRDIKHCTLFGPTIQAIATELDSRWKAQDFTPRPLLTRPPSPPPPALPPPATPLTWIPFSSNISQHALRLFPTWFTPSLLTFPPNDILATHHRLFHSLTRSGTRYRCTTTKPSSTFGNNSIPVGTWFPYRECIRRDGGHGAVQAGIYGTQDMGAYSIVSTGSSPYHELDKDNGDELLYSGAVDAADLGSRVTKTNDTMKLERSKFSGKPVRVFRGKGTGEWATKVGFRYDGLYVVERNDMKKHMIEGVEKTYWQFTLRRLIGQEPLKSVVERSPSRLELAAYLWDLQMRGMLGTKRGEDAAVQELEEDGGSEGGVVTGEDEA